MTDDRDEGVSCAVQLLRDHLHEGVNGVRQALHAEGIDFDEEKVEEVGEKLEKEVDALEEDLKK